MPIDFSERYRVKSWNLAVAVRPVEYLTDPKQEWHFIGEEGDDDEDQSNYQLEEWEEVDEDRVYVVMVGDDAKHLVEVDDLELISEDDYCPSCGQIGCGWH